MLRFSPLYQPVTRAPFFQRSSIRLTQQQLLSLSLKPVKPSLSSIAIAQAPALVHEQYLQPAIVSPTRRQLRVAALQAAIPMIGFGFMDNVVLIQAGEAIDMSLGVTLGLSTMAAAALGQCVSNVAGLTSGGIVDAGVARLRLPTHGLNSDQLSLRVTRVYQTMGSCLGVVFGGLLGMVSLFFVDTTKAERIRRERELHSVLESVVREAHAIVGCEEVTLWLLDEETGELGTRITNTDQKNQVEVDPRSGVVGACLDSGKVLNISDADNDNKCCSQADMMAGFQTRNVLAVPILEDDKPIGAIRLVNKRVDQDGNCGAFLESDEKFVRVLGTQISSLIRIARHGD